jgi:hypothetical protein
MIYSNLTSIFIFIFIVAKNYLINFIGKNSSQFFKVFVYLLEKYFYKDVKRLDYIICTSSDGKF